MKKQHGCLWYMFFGPVYLCLWMTKMIVIYALAIPFVMIKELAKLITKGHHGSSSNKQTGIDYENYCADYLRSRGFHNVKVTKASGDQGVDIIAKKGGHTYAVQCKHYSGSVGNGAVQEVFAGKAFYNCDRAMVLTNSEFTQSAKELAKSTGVELKSGVSGGNLSSSSGCGTIVILIILFYALYYLIDNKVTRKVLLIVVGILAVLGLIYIVYTIIQKIHNKYKETSSTIPWEEETGDDAVTTSFCANEINQTTQQAGEKQDYFDEAHIEINPQLWKESKAKIEESLPEMADFSNDGAALSNLVGNYFIEQCSREDAESLCDYLVARNSPHTLQLYIIDREGFYQQLNSYVMQINKTIPFDSDSHIYYSVLNKRIYDRLELFKDAGVRNIQNYNSAHPSSMLPYIVLFIIETEAAAGALSDPDCVTLYMHGNTAGVHVIATSQSIFNKSSLKTLRSLFHVIDARNMKSVFEY